jgi:serine/threonine protein kinase
MATPHDPLPSAAPADAAATNSMSDLSPTAGGAASLATVSTGPPTSAGRYVLGDEIARGGMGVVYRATDTTLGREVAVKVLLDKFEPGGGAARRFADEARITGQLAHPAIPPVHDLGTLPDGRPFLAMKLVKGQTLDTLLKARTNPGEDRGRFVAVFEQVCQALACAHDHGVIHRDLKPANVMVGNSGEVQVMDWGLAKVLGTRPAPAADPNATRAGTAIQSLRDSDGEHTQAGSILGTPAFMPPEQAIGAVDQVDARSDVFGLGGILCVILTGRAPFEGDSAESIRQAAARGKVAEALARLDACGADPELVALCKRCLAAEKGERPADAGEVARTVAGLRTAAEERARRAEVERAAAEARSAERRKRRRLMVAAAAVVAAAVVGGLSAVLWVQRRANSDLTAKNKELADEQAKAEKQSELARKAIATLHTGVSEDMLLKNDQFKELRTRLLKEAADFYADQEKLLEGQSDPKSRRQLADGYYQLAELTGKIGSMTDALALHRKALTVRQELAAAPGADVETRLDVARSLGAVGLLLCVTGDVDGGMKSYAEQQALAGELERESPTEAVRTVLGQNLTATSLVLVETGKLEEALAINGKAVALFRALIAGNPDDTRHRSELAQCLTYRGMVLFELGRWAEEFEAEDEARRVLEGLVEGNPNALEFKFSLAHTQNNMGSTLFDEGKPAEALGTVEKARVLAQQVVDTYPSAAQFQRLLATTHANRGQALAELGRFAEALASQQRASALFSSMVETNPNDVTAQCFQASAEFDIGDLLERQGKRVEALPFYEKAVAQLRKQSAAHPTYYPQLLQARLARSLEKLGLYLSASGKAEQVLAACQEAVSILEKLCQAHSAFAFLRGELAESHAVLGRVQGRAGRPAEAAASFRSAAARMEQLPTFSARNYYNVACYQALLARVATDAGSGLTADEGTAAAERGMVALRRAVAAGYSNVFQLRTDGSLDTLRPREDFRNLVKELQEKSTKAQEVAPLPGSN